MEFPLNDIMLDAGLMDFSNMTYYEFGRNIILPFLLSFIILWSVLERIRFFNKSSRLIISLGISILLATTSSFIVMSEYISSVAGTSMVVIFGIVLIGGTVLWGIKSGVDTYYALDKDKAITKLREKIAKLRREYRGKRDPEILKQIKELEKRIEQLEFELKDKLSK